MGGTVPEEIGSSSSDSSSVSSSDSDSSEAKKKEGEEKDQEGQEAAEEAEEGREEGQEEGEEARKEGQEGWQEGEEAPPRRPRGRPRGRQRGGQGGEEGQQGDRGAQLHARGRAAAGRRGGLPAHGRRAVRVLPARRLREGRPRHELDQRDHPGRAHKRVQPRGRPHREPEGLQDVQGDQRVPEARAAGVSGHRFPGPLADPSVLLATRPARQGRHRHCRDGEREDAGVPDACLRRDARAGGPPRARRPRAAGDVANARAGAADGGGGEQVREVPADEVRGDVRWRPQGQPDVEVPAGVRVRGGVPGPSQ
mmetsp:Transcript_6286/g.16774  ORF Transcript_6286/g.16774 Transcript_6286/m.16774 type:complete len:310 (-) Transcript_6286:107-1036(-)